MSNTNLNCHISEPKGQILVNFWSVWDTIPDFLTRRLLGSMPVSLMSTLNESLPFNTALPQSTSTNVAALSTTACLTPSIHHILGRPTGLFPCGSNPRLNISTKVQVISLIRSSVMLIFSKFLYFL